MLLALTVLAGSARRMEDLTEAEAPARGIASSPPKADRALEEASRRDLLETFDKIVAYEGYYRSVYGRYTRLLSRIGYSIPGSLQGLYAIRINEASSNRLLVTALSEVDGRVADIASVDQDFRLQANFPIPTPRVEYARLVARKYVRMLKDSPSVEKPREPTVFQGYFSYKVRYGSEGQKEFVAQGMRAPVEGVEVAISDGSPNPDQDWSLFASLEQETSEMSKKPSATASLTGQWSRGEMSATLEQAYLAQRIFHGETGRYARNWDELSKVAAFRFEGKDQYGSDAAPFGDAPARLDQTALSIRREPAEKLDIEPILDAPQHDRVPSRENSTSR